MENLNTYLFSHPGPDLIGLDLWVTGGIALIVLSWVFRWLIRRKKFNDTAMKLALTWRRQLFWFGLAGLVLIFLRVENATFWQARFFFLVWWLLLVFTFVRNIRKYKKAKSVIIVRRGERSESAVEKKWSPKGKKYGR